MWVFYLPPGKTVFDPYFDGKGLHRLYLLRILYGRVSGGGEKNTLDKNYLYLAEGLGADIIRETMVPEVKKPSQWSQSNISSDAFLCVVIFFPITTYINELRL